jgi:WXG100 family type VII secretion target
MADQIRVDFGSLNTAVADIATGVATQGERLAQLKADIAPMVATWEGGAQAAYYAAQTKWDTAWEDLTQALQAFQRSTGAAHDDYQAGETANTASWA